MQHRAKGFDRDGEVPAAAESLTGDGVQKLGFARTHR
jgi:hypothetical protein